MTGAIIRAKSIKSSRLEYRLESGVVGANVLPPNRSSTKVLTFSSGSDWIERDRESAAALVNYGGYFMRYDEVRQPDGSVRRTATISQPRSFEDPGIQNRRPWFAGSFWLGQQIEYVEQHRAEFRLAMPSNVKGIRCEVCEFDVPAEDVVPAFRVHSPLLAAGGTLRVHVAPQLGFVLPLVEVYPPKGVRVVTYESKNLLEFPDHTYIPSQIRMELRAPGGETVYEQFTIAADLVNQSIPDSEFIVKIPAGTQIRDERDAEHVRRFDLASDSTSAVLGGQDRDQRDSVARETAHSSRGRSWVLGGALVIAAVCLALAIRRLRLRS